MLEIKTSEQAQNLVLGATILGTGGGGDPVRGLQMLNEVLNEGKLIKVVKLKELSKDSVIAVPYFVGTIAPGVKVKKSIKIEDPISRAVEELESFLGKKITAVVASELGGGNTPTALYIGAKLGLPVVDGDLLGRAAPELHQCTVHIYGIPMYPAAIATETGNVVLVKEYADIDDYEALARYLSVLGGRHSAVVDTPMNYKDADKALIKDSITLSLTLGKAVINARKEGKDPIEAVVKLLKGWKVFEGIVQRYEWRDEKGFLKGEALIKGIKEFETRMLKSWIMNEHIMVWIDNEPLVMPPDLFILLRKDGEPVTNTDLKEGMDVIAVAAKAHKMWKTPEGLKYFGPRHFGFHYEYIPIEELVRERLGL